MSPYKLRTPGVMPRQPFPSPTVHEAHAASTARLNLLMGSQGAPPAARPPNHLLHAALAPAAPVVQAAPPAMPPPPEGPALVVS